MHESLANIAGRICANADTTVKPVKFYAIYDRYFDAFSDRAITLLELGVYSGESLKVWASYFPRGTIIGVDIMENRADLSGYPNIIFERGDQADSDRLKDILLGMQRTGSTSSWTMRRILAMTARLPTLPSSRVSSRAAFTSSKTGARDISTIGQMATTFKGSVPRQSMARSSSAYLAMTSAWWVS